MLISWDREHFFLNHEGTFGNQKGLISWCWLGLFAVCGNDYRLQLNRMKPCNLFNCILRIKRSLNLLVSYAYFDICGGIKRASSRGYSTRMQFPQTFCPTCDKQVISSTYGQLMINFTGISKAFPKLKICVKLILHCPRAHAISYTKRNLNLNVKKTWQSFYRRPTDIMTMREIFSRWLCRRETLM